MKYLPCIDLHDGKVKQIVGQTLTNNNSDSLRTNFVSDKSAGFYANMFKADKLSDGHVIMLGKNNELQLEEALTCYPNNFSAGGGMNPQNAGLWLLNGAKKIIVSSFIFDDGLFSENKLIEMMECTDKSKLVIDLSCKFVEGSYRIMTNKWQRTTDLTLNVNTLTSLARYTSEFLIHAVDVEGTGLGIDRNLIQLLSSFKILPVTYAGGISSIDDIEYLKTAGKNRINFTVGSGLDIYGGKDLKYSELVTRYGQE